MIESVVPGADLLKGLPQIDLLNLVRDLDWGSLLQNQWARAFGLLIIVVITIWAIAKVYSGDLQNTEIGPVAIRPHTSTRAGLSGIVMPKDLRVPFTMDGVNADVAVHYVYDDARGKRRSWKLVKRSLTLNVQPNKLPKIQQVIFGHEVPDVPQESVCYPQFNVETEPREIGRTAERAQQYVADNNIQEKWTADDSAVLVSVPQSMFEEVEAERRDRITRHAEHWERLRGGNVLARAKARQLARNRPNVIGSYYLKFQFRSNPLFVLLKHPDRELKMTAWLTVLTSMFAVIMDAWPIDGGRDPARTTATVDQPVERAARVPRVP